VGAARIAFQLDEQVALAVAQALRRRGIDVRTASESNLLGASDEDVLARARLEERVLVTHDRDFLILHQRGHPHAGIAYCGQGMRTIGQVIAGMVLIYEILEPAEMSGRVEFL
jgi:predicted nuclease of predicted toxin-antitoxin system